MCNVFFTIYLNIVIFEITILASESNGIRTQNYLVRKQKLTHLAKLDIAPVSSKVFLDTQATIECRFTLKCVHDMIITYSHYSYISGIRKWITGEIFKFFLSTEIFSNIAKNRANNLMKWSINQNKIWKINWFFITSKNCFPQKTWLSLTAKRNFCKFPEEIIPG